MTTSFSQTVDDFLESLWQHDPIRATRVGIHRYDDSLANVNADAMDAWGKTLHDFTRRFEAFDPDTLSSDERLDRQWALASLERMHVEHELRAWEREPRFYLDSLGGGLHDLLLGQYAPAEERFRALQSRLEAIPAFLETARHTLIPADVPPIWVEFGLMTAKSLKQFISEAIPQAVTQVPALEEDVTAASQAAAQAISDFQTYIRELEGQAGGNFAIGRDRFDRLLQGYHMLEMDSDDLYAFGRDWIERYEQEMAEVARQIDPDANWVDALEIVKDDHPTAENLRQAYDDETMLAREHCLERDLITFPEGEHVDVEWMPAFLRASSPIAKPWVSPPFEEGLTGKWYITPIDSEAPAEQQRQHLRDNSWAWIRGIAMHEMYPGHHLHMAIYKQVATPLRKQFWSPIYVEGWGLYTEELFYETGFLADPPLRLMQLRNGLWRAVRIVVDTGLHTRGMGVEEAAGWLVDRARLEPRWAQSEVRLYTTRPTYPSSYRVGLSEVMDLREAYRNKVGSEFTLKGFHDTLMGYSMLPLTLIKEEMLQ